MMDIDTIMSLLPHRYPFLMIDRIEEVDPGERAVAIKCVSVNEPQFQGHFPHNPIMPGVLITEAFAQTQHRPTTLQRSQNHPAKVLRPQGARTT